MSNNNNDIIYTAKDIEQYLAGKLTPQQMHAIEKAALNDNLLADAIEGYQTVTPNQWTNELAQLKTAFENKHSTAKVIALPKRNNNWIKVAAAILLIGGTATLSYFILGKKDSQQIAQNVTTLPSADTLIPSIAEDNIAKTETTSAKTQKLDVEKQNDVAKTSGQITEVILADSNFVYKPSSKLAEQSTAKKYEQNTLNDIAATESKQVTTNAAPASVSNNQAERENVKPVYQADAEKDFAKAKNADKDNKEPQLTKVFVAQVVGSDNTPLPFANINIKTENFGTYTDVKGNFRLVSSDSILTVEVKSAGYQTQFYTLKSSLTQNKIILPEVDVTNRQTTVISSNKAGRSKLSKRATLLKDSVVDVEPADGWDNYNTYVDNNIDIPDDILKKNVHGQVELSFDVKPNGAITNIKVDKSLCNNCDEAAKQLLQQGPKWKTKNGKKGKAKVTVQF